jgi:UDP-N-acetylmuramyl pentapeptide phosphotransferase/UDP-N-acetylglucosamine-1-phosphate transferase
MKPYTLLGIILIVVAVAAFGYQGISYTTKEKVVDLGPLEVTADKTRTLPLTPIVGGIALIGGIALLVVGQKNR